MTAVSAFSRFDMPGSLCQLRRSNVPSNHVQQCGHGYQRRQVPTVVKRNDTLARQASCSRGVSSSDRGFHGMANSRPSTSRNCRMW